MPFIRKVYTKFRTYSQPTCELEWGDRKGKVTLKLFFLFSGKNVKYKYIRAPQIKPAGRELETSDVSINIRVMES